MPAFCTAAWRAARRSSAMCWRCANSAVSAALPGSSGLIASARWVTGSRATNVNSATRLASSPYSACMQLRMKLRSECSVAERCLEHLPEQICDCVRLMQQALPAHSSCTPLLWYCAANIFLEQLVKERTTNLWPMLARACLSSIWMSSELLPVHTTRPLTSMSLSMLSWCRRRMASTDAVTSNGGRVFGNPSSLHAYKQGDWNVIKCSTPQPSVKRSALRRSERC